ncbi:hypothetical protein GOP47_0015547 [Adiantum capillus-veneris]|uniref:Uncharacterized protein n=1 Tax=Adiantum capillus-veneris TaxID=13818 RepID=A0A9D4UJX1_ADICA|nr:hypothetical protein GOP47_0015547 [Adiantum capillus-veneris]
MVQKKREEVGNEGQLPFAAPPRASLSLLSPAQPLDRTLLRGEYLPMVVSIRLRRLKYIINRWEYDSPIMTPNLSKDSPPSSPKTPLLSGDVKPLNGFSCLKLGYPFKGSLKRLPPQRPYVSPSSEEECLITVDYNDVAELDSNRTEKRSIKWLDNFGKELIQVKEFEASDCEDSDEEEHLFASCTCAIQ